LGLQPHQENWYVFFALLRVPPEDQDLNFDFFRIKQDSLSKASKKKETKAAARRREAEKSRQTGIILLVVVIVAIIAIAAVVYLHGSSTTSTNTTSGITTFTNPSNKPVILYVNQGNGVVNRTNFPQLLSFAKAQHFNTIFFQIYRSGQLLFSTSDLEYFAEAAGLQNISFFYSLYFTNSSQSIPNSIYNLGEKGINLDMSTLPVSVQSGLLATLKLDLRNGTTAVTSTNLTTTLKPEWLILETYDFAADQQYIHSGIIAAVEPLALNSTQEYVQDVQYSLSNSAGVLVFDYYGLMKTQY